ncbi:MAG: hypothetical protein Q8908_06560 [Bacteroidota bacterium]|nr:hypothetical protein [Bacteroidota bacterium]
MKSKVFPILSIFLSFFWGCQKENAEHSMNTGLVGRWEWVSTTGGLAGVHQTPQTLGYTYWVEFTKDSLYRVYDKNRILVSSNPYSLFKEISIFDNKEHEMIKADNLIRSSFVVRNDTLFLRQEVMDGFDEVFVGE